MPDPVRDRAIELVRRLLLQQLPEVLDPDYASLCEHAALVIHDLAQRAPLEAGEAEEFRELVDRLRHAGGSL